MTDFREAVIYAFVQRCQAVVSASRPHAKLSFTMGKKYAKIIEELHGGVWAFVSLENGDILKPDNWTKPAKHARGNIFDEFDGMKYIDAYGPMLLR